MRVLMRDGQDQSLIAFNAQEVIFDPEDQAMILTSGDLSYVVEKVTQINADDYIRELVDQGKVDLSMFNAKANN
ncbi:MAG: hypothetical protein Q3982_03135 [Phoenicibacter congonensis]|uniref:Uncharacterized protein n=1 Tax=Phoenicibacter congonensis TaxID=1944646 RepID=A0AA43RGZ4_9ACTN|nr:hypothetical protein [Phoenicibacter congonensis]